MQFGIKALLLAVAIILFIISMFIDFADVKVWWALGWACIAAALLVESTPWANTRLGGGSGGTTTRT